MVPYWQFFLVGIVTVAMITDLQERKIFNWLTFPSMLLGLILNVVYFGLPGLYGSLLGFVVGVLIFLIGFFMNAMGAGDVKLMAVVGLWLGWPATIAAVIYVTLFGGLISIIAAAANGQLLQMFKNVYWFMVGLFLPGGKANAALAKSAAPPVPYGVSIALGTYLALIYPEPLDLIRLFRGT